MYTSCAVNVSCSGPQLEMKVCYYPHPNVNFSDGWVMSTEENFDRPECTGKTVAINSSETRWCSRDMQALTLNMTTEERNSKCGMHISTTVCITTQTTALCPRKS